MTVLEARWIRGNWSGMDRELYNLKTVLLFTYNVPVLRKQGKLFQVSDMPLKLPSDK